MASRPPKAAVTARGRPATGALRTQVRLTPADIERARVLGAGNVSAGIRAALKTAPKSVQSNAKVSGGGTSG